MTDRSLRVAPAEFSSGGGSISVDPVVSAGDLAAFISLPSRLYVGFREYTPPLNLDRRILLDPKTSQFWKRARACYWLARKDGRVVGRVSAQIDDRTPVGIEPGAGMFGCLDAVDDPAVTTALLKAAEDWLRQQGCGSMFGPCTLSMNNEPGLLIDGADQPAMTLVPWHPPYLQAHVESFGLAKWRDLYNWRLDFADATPLSPQGALRLGERMPGLRIRSVSRKTLARDIEILCNVYNDAWSGNWGFIPLTPADMTGLDQLIRWLVPRQAFRIVELDGEPVAVLLLIPNMFEMLAGMGPAPALLSWPKLAWRALTQRFRSGRIIIMGVVTRLRRTVAGSAIAALLVDELIAGQAALNGDWVEAGWVLEDNDALNKILIKFQFQRNKTFRIFGKTIN